MNNRYFDSVKAILPDNNSFNIFTQKSVYEISLKSILSHSSGFTKVYEKGDYQNIASFNITISYELLLFRTRKFNGYPKVKLTNKMIESDRKSADI